MNEDQMIDPGTAKVDSPAGSLLRAHVVQAEQMSAYYSQEARRLLEEAVVMTTHARDKARVAESCRSALLAMGLGL